MRKLIAKYRLKTDVNVEHCTPIRLMDGQDWFIKRPMLELHPVFKDGKATHFTKHITLGASLDVLVEAIGAENIDPVQRVQGIQRLGALLIKECYDVTDEELSLLFHYTVGDPASEAMISDIIAAATGVPRLNPLSVNK